MSVSIAGVGCSLMDYLFTGVDFDGPAFSRYRSRAAGDGGLEPGHLVFAEDLERFSGRSYRSVLEEITGGESSASRNLGGPSVVALVHAAQVLAGTDAPVTFHGVRGDDETGAQLADLLQQTPLRWERYEQVPGETPFTHALSDPDYDDGAGERCFINRVGVAGDFSAADIPDSFFDHPIAAFGGTALVPTLHAELHLPVTRAHRGGTLTVINTVYDFLNQSRHPENPWPLGNSAETYAATDLLVVDAEEARRLSGVEDPRRAMQVFRDAGVGAVAITRGRDPVLAAAGSGRFRELPVTEFPVSRLVTQELAGDARSAGDTTGCGDNFVGAVLASIAEQMLAGERRIDLAEAATRGVVAGGYACFFLGGTYLESRPGEKRTRLEPYYRAYREQADTPTKQ